MVLVVDPPGLAQRIGQFIADTFQKIVDRVLTISRNVSDKLQWVNDHIFEKLKWIPISTIFIIVITFFRHPLEFITRVLCAIVISIIFVFYIILTIPPFSWIAFIVWFFVRHVLVLLGFTIVSVVIFCIVALIFGLIALINAMSGGKLNQIALCQTSPLAWYTIPNYQYGNKFERGFFCSQPCTAGYAPDELTGSYCNKIPLAQPSYCPQAEIMRLLLKQARIGERHVFANYIMTPAHLMRPPKEKEADYIKHFEAMQLYLSKCNQKLGSFNGIAVDICSSLDAIKALKMNFLSDSAIEKLKEVCKQGFCNSKSRYVFCGSFSDSAPEAQGGALMKAILYMFIAMALFILLLVMTYKFIYASTK